MAPLPSELRPSIERTLIQARDAAEEAAESALAVLQVTADRLPTGFPEAQRPLRNALRARARQLGQGQFDAGWQPLIEEVAYEQWHRMLFARFLAANQLLMHPSGVPVTLEECAELALEEGDPDAWAVAARYASGMLPGIFRLEDPSAQVSLTPEARQTLEVCLQVLPPVLFTADDGLSWVYQFWQAKRREEVNADGGAIGGADLFPVTQLFTEDYMVRFLLENTLGAWWTAHHPASPLAKQFHYLRFHDDGIPAAGTFAGWPATVAQLTVMDPCCGSGHFLVTAFEMLHQMYMEERGLDSATAAAAVLRDNLFGLELDPRCAQIAAFALAFAAWKAIGYRELPTLNIACSGIPVNGQLETWTSLAGADPNLRYALERLHGLFQNAPDLGSLINPSKVPERELMFTPTYATVGPILARILSKAPTQDDMGTQVFGAAAQAAFLSSELLAKTYTLVATNVPYLIRRNQQESLQDFCETHYEEAKGNLATVFVQRCLEFAASGGTIAVVTPHNWLSHTSYTKLRISLLRSISWDVLASLGSKAFQTPMWDFGVALSVISNAVPDDNHQVLTSDVSHTLTFAAKAEALRNAPLHWIGQNTQLGNPDARIIVDELDLGPLLSMYADSFNGTTTGDDPKVRRYFFEFPKLAPSHVLLQGTVSTTRPYGGLESILLWGELPYGMESLVVDGAASVRGRNAWGKRGIAVSQMGKLPVALYLGDHFDVNTAAVIPRDPKHLAAIWAFCSSPEFNNSVRRIDKALKVTNSTLVKVPFDLDKWQELAKKIDPLPEEGSNDPTQRLFDGRVAGASSVLQVAVARLLGYRWPNQSADGLESYVDQDGIVSLCPVFGMLPAQERLRTLLAASFGEQWTVQKLGELLETVGYAGREIGDWLQDGFFHQHCALFLARPFIWHIWDGRKDGFSALINYHKFDIGLLNKLIYTYLGSWLSAQKADVQAGIPGSEGRVVAALNLQKKLEAIRDGEPPFDIYVRWKTLYEQPLGWNPDLNDGIRLNIRPFVRAGVLRTKFRVHWNKDRGKNVDGSDRLNDLNFTLAEKLAARKKAGVKA